MWKPGVALFIATSMGGSWVGRSAHAVENYSAGDVSSLNADAVGALVQTVALGSAHRSFSGAGVPREVSFGSGTTTGDEVPSGVMLPSAHSWDLGIDYTWISASNEFVQGLRRAGVARPIAKTLSLPRLQIRRALPENLGVAASFSTYSGYRIFGLEGQWAWKSEMESAVSSALRLSYTRAEWFFIRSNTLKLESVWSKRWIWRMEPFVGAALLFANGSVEVPRGGATGLRASVTDSSKEFGLNAHLGMALDFDPVKVAWLYETGFDRVRAMGGRVSFAF